MDIISRKQAINSGVKYYFTGKPCKHGHIAQRRANSKGCLECERVANGKDYSVEARARYANKNRARHNERNREWYSANKVQKALSAKQWRLRNPEVERAISKRNYEKNKEAVFLRSRLRKANIKNVIPAWADLDDIRNFYIEAKYFCLEIDHIVPLKSDIVCGLHVESNLRAISRFENRSKGNRHWPDMP